MYYDISTLGEEKNKRQNKICICVWTQKKRKNVVNQLYSTLQYQFENIWTTNDNLKNIQNWKRTKTKTKTPQHLPVQLVDCCMFVACCGWWCMHMMQQLVVGALGQWTPDSHSHASPITAALCQPITILHALTPKKTLPINTLPCLMSQAFLSLTPLSLLKGYQNQPLS
jgi:hypothetical protein